MMLIEARAAPPSVACGVELQLSYCPTFLINFIISLVLLLLCCSQTTLRVVRGGRVAVAAATVVPLVRAKYPAGVPSA